MNKNAWLKYSETVEEEMHLQFAKITDEIFHEILSKLPVREFERRTFNMKRFLKNGYL